MHIEYINDIKNRLSQLAQQNTQYLNTFYQLGLTGTSQPQQIPKFMKEIYGWETMNDTQKVEAIERQLKSYFYAYSDYLNCYLFNGIGALLQLVSFDLNIFNYYTRGKEMILWKIQLLFISATPAKTIFRADTETLRWATLTRLPTKFQLF